MTIVDTKTFHFEDKEYETRVVFDSGIYKVEVFHQGKKATPYTYSVDFETDGNCFGHEHLYRHLMQIAEADTCAKRWLNR